MIAVQFDKVSKAYDLHAGERTILRSIRTVSGLQKKDDLFYALSDVSFTINKGDAFGIIGRNGAGKSTILKIISGITQPTSGQVTVNGLVSSLIELGAGFHPDLTGRENVYLSAEILGITKKVIDRKFKEIVDFAELWDFIDVPVKKYSSGMYARLGFSVAISVEPEILIIDEILSVGDVFFQQKCFRKMRELIHTGITFIFVTHDTIAMQNLCSSTILLDGGRIDFIGTTMEAVSRYYARVGQRTNIRNTDRVKKTESNDFDVESSALIEKVMHHSVLSDVKRHGAKGMSIIAARVTNEAGEDVSRVFIHDELNITILISSSDDILKPECGIHLFDRTGTLVFAAGTRQLGYTLPPILAGEKMLVQMKVSFNLTPGEYTYGLSLAEPTATNEPNIGFIHDSIDTIGPIKVVWDDNTVLPFYGVAKLPMNITHRVLGKTRDG